MIERGQHQPVLDTIRRSAIAARLADTSRRLESAAQRSRALQFAATSAAAWSGLDRSERRRALGVCLVVAPTMHCALTVLGRGSAGWMWLVVPAIALAQGALLIAAAGSSAVDR